MAIFVGTFLFAVEHPNDNRAFNYFVLSAPGLVWSVHCAMNCSIFGWRHSVFGPRKKTQRPSGFPIATRRTEMTRFGNLTVPAVKWAFYCGGADISSILGRVWLPQSCVFRIVQSKSTIEIVHDCEEVVSPIKVPAEIGELIDATFGKQAGAFDPASIGHFVTPDVNPIQPHSHTRAFNAASFKTGLMDKESRTKSNMPRWSKKQSVYIAISGTAFLVLAPMLFDLAMDRPISFGSVFAVILAPWIYLVSRLLAKVEIPD